VLGIQFFSMGFIGEYLTYLAQKQRRFVDLPIREETGGAPRRSSPVPTSD
jgi:hypothetical protein